MGHRRLSNPIIAAIGFVLVSITLAALGQDTTGPGITGNGITQGLQTLHILANPLFEILGSPATADNSTVMIDFAPDQPAGQFLATPSGSTGTPTLRSIVFSDLPGGLATAPLSGQTGNIGAVLLLLGSCTTGTATVTGATLGMPVQAAPLVDPGAGVIYYGTVTAANTVTVRECGLVSITPPATKFNVRVYP